MRRRRGRRREIRNKILFKCKSRREQKRNNKVGLKDRIGKQKKERGREQR